MLSELISWFAGRMSDRRQYARKVEPFAAWWIVDEKTAKPMVGIEVSASGLQVMLKEAPPTADFNLIMQVKERRIKARVSIAWSDKAEDKGETWHRLGCKFAGIAADDWDFLVRYVNDQDDVGNKLANELDELAARPDDAYRLVPQAIQLKIVEMLVARGRLAEPSPGASPLLKLFYGGVQTHPDGRKTYRLNVHSRIMQQEGDGEMVAYDTRFTVDDTGELKIL